MNTVHSVNQKSQKSVKNDEYERVGRT